MIRISITYSDNAAEITARGHAGYCPGNDIVCASVSTLLQTLGTYLARNGIGTGEFRSGDITVRSGSPVSLPFFRETEHGLRALAKTFPHNVAVLDTADKAQT